MQRRRFLQSACAAAATTSVSTDATDATDAAMSQEIIDTHQHLWDPAVINPPWLQSAPAKIQAKLHLAEYRQATEGLKVTAIYMEIDVAPADLDREAEQVIALCQDPASRTVAATIGGRPDAPGFSNFVKKHAVSGKIRGVRQVLHGAGTPAGYCLRPEFVRGVRFLGTQGLHFDLCMRPAELMDGVALAKQCPSTRFVVDHCGNGDVTAPVPEMEQWKRSIDALAALPNTICKISGIIARLPEGRDPLDLAPIVNHCLDAFGPDRVVFGGDWPVCLLGGALRTWVDTLTKIISNRPAQAQTALWAENARNFYRLA
jgi:L-fuconolactonase